MTRRQAASSNRPSSPQASLTAHRLVRFAAGANPSRSTCRFEAESLLLVRDPGRDAGLGPEFNLKLNKTWFRTDSIEVERDLVQDRFGHGTSGSGPAAANREAAQLGTGAAVVPPSQARAFDQFEVASLRERYARTSEGGDSHLPVALIGYRPPTRAAHLPRTGPRLALPLRWSTPAHHLLDAAGAISGVAAVDAIAIMASIATRTRPDGSDAGAMPLVCGRVPQELQGNAATATRERLPWHLRFDAAVALGIGRACRCWATAGPALGGSKPERALCGWRTGPLAGAGAAPHHCGGGSRDP